MRQYTSPDGTQWSVTVRSPGSSNAMIVFRHPDGDSARRDRYNWVLRDGPEARSVTGRLTPERVLESLGEPEVAALFRRSMPVSRPTPRGRPVGSLFG